MFSNHDGRMVEVKFRVVIHGDQWAVVVGLGKGDRVTVCNTKEDAEKWARRMNGCFSVLEGAV